MNTVETLIACAEAAGRARRFAEATTLAREALVMEPDHPGALAVLGVVLAQEGRVADAIGFLERACAHPRAAPSWFLHLSALLRGEGRLTEALEAALHVVRGNAATSDALLNLALTQIELGQSDNAAVTLVRAVGIAPNDAACHLALAQLLLTRGEFAPGWIEYEWRNQILAARGTMPPATSAAWNGMRIPDGRLLLVGDQGYGDTIQFARYIPMVAARCQEVVLACSKELAGLLACMPGVSRAVTVWNEAPNHAAYCRLSSLPYVFQTRVESIPSTVPYLRADPALVAAWRARLEGAEKARPPRIGLAWAGRPTHANDHRRSMRLDRLRTFAEAAPHAVFVSLQKPFPEPDRAASAAFPGLTDLSAELTDFAQTAALLTTLDLVISVDTAVGHLAGAMGLPVFLLLATPSDWRWLTDRADSPWYPTMTLFRQDTPGAWQPVIDSAAHALQLFLLRRIPRSEMNLG